MADFETTSVNFLTWFLSIPGAKLHPGIRLTDLRSRNAGRGMVATENILHDTELFVIPRKSIISVENSSLSTRLPHIFTTLNGQPNVNQNDGGDIELPDPWLDLILVLIYEFLQGLNSPWKPYFDVLPQTFDTPMFWTEAELAELQCSALREKIGKAKADEMFRTKVLPIIHANSAVFYLPGAPLLTDDTLMMLAHRMGSTIMAYAFDLEKDDEDDAEDEEGDGWVQDKEGLISLGMVPVADMLNADAPFNAHLNHGDDALTMTSIDFIAAGKEVLNYYGPLPNCDLLRRYGYMLDQHRRFDVVEMPWETVLQACKEQYAGKVLGKPDPEEVEDGFVFDLDPGEGTETALNIGPVQFVGFPEELEAQVYRVIAKPLKIKLTEEGVGPDKVSKKRLKAAFFEVMSRAIPARIKQYGTTVKEDQKHMADQGVNRRMQMAIQIRIAEKELLQHGLTYANYMLAESREEETRQAIEDAGGRPAKKRKTR